LEGEGKGVEEGEEEEKEVGWGNEELGEGEVNRW
jgi:hypothetical protein